MNTKDTAMKTEQELFNQWHFVNFGYIGGGEGGEYLTRKEAWDAGRAPLLSRIAELEAEVAYHREVSVNRAWQARQLDILLNGAGAAQKPSLCDIISQVRKEGIKSASYIAIDAAMGMSDE